jgi:hypothetical protein
LGISFDTLGEQLPADHGGSARLIAARSVWRLGWEWNVMSSNPQISIYASGLDLRRRTGFTVVKRLSTTVSYLLGSLITRKCQ